MMMNVSGEQGIDAALNMTTSGASNGFRFSKWVFKMGWKGTKLVRNHHKGAKEKRLDLMSDACSAYRGGHVHKGNSEELSSLVRELGGNDATKLGGNEIFLGDRTDLSLFWKKTENNKHVSISRARLEGIEDPTLRGRVIGTFTKAQLDGLVAYDGNTYALTSKGREAILDPDFVQARIRGECKLFADATEQLQADAAQAVNDRIDVRLKELGLEGKFDGCDRITLNKERLFRADAGGSSRFYVPGTARRMTVELPKESLIELDSKTYAGFLDKDAKYKTLVNGRESYVSGEELFRHFDSKNKIDTQAMRTSVDRAETAAKSFDNSDFFAAALKRSYAGSDLFAGDKLDAAFTPKQGETFTVFADGAAGKDFTVTGTWQDELGGTNYNLRAVDGSTGDILLPEEAFGEIAFADRAEGAERVAANPEGTARYRELISEQLPTDADSFEVGDAVEDVDGAIEGGEINTYNVKRGDWSVTGDSYDISTKGRDYVSTSIPAADAAQNPDGSLTVDIHTDKTYDVATGKEGIYDAKQSGKALSKVLGKPAETAKKTARASAKATQAATKAVAQSAKATAQGLKMAASGIEGAAKATDAVATTTTKTAETAAAAIPPVEAITATVKVVLDASAKTAKVAAKTATTAAKAGAKGIKAGAKGVEAASKAHGASQKM